jgi:hypothetical protein
MALLGSVNTTATGSFGRVNLNKSGISTITGSYLNMDELLVGKALKVGTTEYAAATSAADGAQGSQGGAGPTGAQGAQGGSPGGGTGPTGHAGAQGAQGGGGSGGPTGPTGATGATGAQGSQGGGGPTGPTGATGAQGGQGGSPGGHTGATGAQGSQGGQGSPGGAGPQGASGATGATGSQGSQGSLDSGGTWTVSKILSGFSGAPGTAAAFHAAYPGGGQTSYLWQATFGSALVLNVQGTHGGNAILEMADSGTTTRFRWNANGTVSGGVSTSDRRLKTNVTSITGSMTPLIVSMSQYTKRFSFVNPMGEHQINTGYIAQDITSGSVEMNELVQSMVPKEDMNFGDFYSFDYDGMRAVNTKVVAELWARAKALNTRITVLEG